MKANEAPEKIYISAIDLEEVGHFLTESNDKYDVEYIRADVFIEKAAEWLIDNTDITHTGIKNFRKIMKGK